MTRLQPDEAAVLLALGRYESSECEAAPFSAICLDADDLRSLLSLERQGLVEVLLAEHLCWTTPRGLSLVEVLHRQAMSAA